MGILGVRKIEPVRLNPIIEIMGPPDIGKKLISRLVAKKIFGLFVELPDLNPEFFAGQALLHWLRTAPRRLEENPEYWAHIYAANLYESKEKIESLRLKYPVVVTNYTQSHKAWMRCSGLDTDYIKGFTYRLPRPNMVIVLGGEEVPHLPGNFKVNFSSEIYLKLRAYFTRKLLDRYCTSVEIPEKGKLHSKINAAAAIITKKYKDKYQREISESIFLSPDLV